MFGEPTPFLKGCTLYLDQSDVLSIGEVEWLSHHHREVVVAQRPSPHPFCHRRNRNGINARSKLEILVADADCYLAKVDDKIILKMGPRYELGDLSPKEEEGWKLAASGNNYAVWENIS